MSNSFSTGLSGLRANALAVDTVGNNLANLNTPGFKASAVQFRDLVSPSTQQGLGTAPPTVSRQFSQGSVQASNGLLDAAVSGDGFFVLRGAENQRLYSRAGNFLIDQTGRLTHTGGVVQGWSASNGAINTNGPIGDITVPFALSRPGRPSSTMALDVNLNAAAIVGEPSGTFSTSMEVFDSLGASHTVDLEFTKTAANAWTYTVTMAGEEFTGGAAGTPRQIATGSLAFDTSGTLTTPAPPTATGGGTIDLDISGLANGAADLDVAWSLFGSDLSSRITQTAQQSASYGGEQNGSRAAQMLSIDMADGGKLVAQFSNGEILTLGQLALARFRNPDSLAAAGDNSFQAGFTTSDASIGLPESGGRGKVVAQALEGSTVDIAQEFTNLIVYQRGYQANSRVITTSDELLQETLNIKR